MIALDQGWIARHPLPPPEHATDKNMRGRVLAVGGSAIVPGALLLTGEAALRAGAGKVQLATIADAALPIGLRFPEAGVFPLAPNAAGELGEACAGTVAGLIGRCDVLVLGPGMGREANGAAILHAVLAAEPQVPLLLDAAVLHAAGSLEDALARYPQPKILTPHPGEMAALMGCAATDIGAEVAEAAAARFGATVVLKSVETWIATNGRETLHYAGGGPGLATGGSGDVLAGVIGGLLALRIDQHHAAAWGVWAHGEAGRELARSVGLLGFLGRELLPVIPHQLPR